jgi:hypothetical protein
MSENATINQSVQVGVQTGAGAVPATRRLRTLSVTPNVAVETAAIRTTGDKFAATVVKTKEWSTVSVEGTPDYRELGYLLASCVGNGVETVDGSEHTQVWQTNRACSDTVRPLTVERGKVCGTAIRASDVHLSGLTLGWRRSDGTGTVSAEGFGKALELDTTLTGNQVTELTISGTPTDGTFTLDVNTVETAAIAYDATASTVAAAVEAVLGTGATVIGTGGPLPTNPVTLEFAGTVAQTAVTVAVNDDSVTGGTPAVTVDTAADTPDEFDPLPIIAEHVRVEIDGTPLPRVLSVDIELGDRVSPVWYLDQDASWASTVETEPSLTVSLLMAFDGDAEGIVNLLRTNTVDVLDVVAEGPVVSGVQSRFELTTSFAVEGVEEFSDEDGVYAIGFTLRAVYVNGGPTFTLVNTGNPDLFV